MAFLGGVILITQRISEPQLRDAITHELGAPRNDASMYAKQLSASLSHALAKWRGDVDGSRSHPAVKQVGEIGRLQAGSIYKARHAKAPTGTPLNAKILRPHLGDPISVAPSPGGAAAPRGNLPAETGDKKKNNEKFEIFTVDYDRAPLIGQSGATTAECKLAPGPDGMCAAKVHGDDEETEVEVEELEVPAVKKAKPAAAVAPERKYTAMWCKRDWCSAVRENFGNERQACSIGKKSDRYSKEEKMKAAEGLAKLLHENKSKLL
ncbi:unnamed protein product, partial [Prorocentrum cordatum]